MVNCARVTSTNWYSIVAHVSQRYFIVTSFARDGCITRAIVEIWRKSTTDQQCDETIAYPRWYIVLCRRGLPASDDSADYTEPVSTALDRACNARSDNGWTMQTVSTVNGYDGDALNLWFPWCHITRKCSSSTFDRVYMIIKRPWWIAGHKLRLQRAAYEWPV